MQNLNTWCFKTRNSIRFKNFYLILDLDPKILIFRVIFSINPFKPMNSTNFKTFIQSPNFKNSYSVPKFQKFCFHLLRICASLTPIISHNSLLCSYGNCRWRNQFRKRLPSTRNNERAFLLIVCGQCPSLKGALDCKFRHRCPTA